MILSLTIAVVAAFGAPGVDSDRDTARAILERGYQTELPGVGGVPPAVERPEGGDMVDDGEARESRRRARGAGAIPMLARIFLWLVIGLLAVFLVAWIVSEIAGRSRETAVAPDPSGADRPGAEEVAAVIDAPLGDAEALAADGRYAEAIHTLLLQTLRELAQRAPEPIPSSLTSREILARVALPDAAREALGVLVTRVEHTHFGGRAPDLSVYQGCRDAFDRFAAAYRAGGAR